MSKNNNAKQTRGVTLRDPKDARRIVKRLIDTAFREGLEMEYFGKIVNGLTCWAKLWELESLSNLEARMTALEEEIQKNKEVRRGNEKRVREAPERA